MGSSPVGIGYEGEMLRLWAYCLDTPPEIFKGGEKSA